MKCPVCAEEFYIEFTDQELKKGAKYIECRHCYWLLRISFNGDPEPVPLFLSLKPPYKTLPTISQLVGQFMSIPKLN